MTPVKNVSRGHVRSSLSRFRRSALFASALLMLPACASPFVGTATTKNTLVIYTDAMPTSIALFGDKAWFAYGESVNAQSGVEFIQGHQHATVLRSDPEFIVQDVIGTPGGVWFSASQGHHKGILGTVSAKGLVDRFIFTGDYADVTYDSLHHGFVFSRGNANDYGRIQAGRLSSCKLPEGSLWESKDEGPRFIAAGGGTVWLFSDVETSLIMLGRECGRPLMVRVPLPGPNMPRDLGGLAVDGNGAAWLLNIKEATVIVVTRKGLLSVLHPEISGKLSSINAVDGTICVTSDRPSLIGCYVNRRWRTRPLPLAGSVSAVTADHSYVWLAYDGLDNWDTGALVRAARSSFLPF